MKRAFRHKIIGEKIYILKNGIGLFGPQLESIAVFDNRDGNLERVKQIVKQLNECDRHTEHPKPSQKKKS